MEQSPKNLERLADGGLRYVNSDEAGLTRRRCGSGFTYLYENGQPVRAAGLKKRLATLAVPPAWTHVWYCCDPRGHIQATGRDERGRKQYVYHAQWREMRERAKFAQLPAMARALCVLRPRLIKDLRRRSPKEAAVLAAAAQLLDMTAIRVGSQRYFDENGTVGLTTLQSRHARINGDRVGLQFKGKSGQSIRITVSDKRLAKILLRCEELPGQRLFRYRSDDGIEEIDSLRFNDYLRRTSKADITAKDFRTWIGTVTVVNAWLDASAPPIKVKEATAAAAKRLGNTAAVARRSYIHPDILEIVTSREPTNAERRCARRSGPILSGAEALCARLLRAQPGDPSRSARSGRRR
jgi:DNA topoisomerase-1